MEVAVAMEAAGIECERASCVLLLPRCLAWRLTCNAPSFPHFPKLSPPAGLLLFRFFFVLQDVVFLQRSSPIFYSLFRISSSNAFSCLRNNTTAGLCVCVLGYISNVSFLSRGRPPGARPEIPQRTLSQVKSIRVLFCGGNEQTDVIDVINGNKLNKMMSNLRFNDRVSFV